MKKYIRIILGLTALTSGSFITAQAGIVDLTRTLTAGTYTYYSLGDSTGAAVTPFTTMFYPGTTSSASWETGQTGASTTGGTSISFSNGKLTNGNTSSFVVGWAGVSGPVSGGGAVTGNHDGEFYILFDLGAVYDLSNVVLTYTNASGQRWSATALQNVYTATSFTGSLSNFTLQSGQIFDAATTTSNVTATYDMTGVAARYVLLDLTVSLSAVGTTNSVGGKLVEVSIMGDSTAVIPEPAHSTLVLALAGAFIAAIGVKRARSSRKVVQTNF